VWRHVQTLRDQIGAAVVFTTHYMDEVEEVCDRLALIHRGRLAAIGAPADLRARQGSDATLDDVFTELTETASRTGGGRQ
jgi:ABC-2 type transport system ATP-binding protein